MTWTDSNNDKILEQIELLKNTQLGLKPLQELLDNKSYIRETGTGMNQEYKEWASLLQVEIYRHLDKLRIEYMRSEVK